MIPLIAVGKDAKELGDFVETYRKEQSIKEQNVRELVPEKDELSIGEIRQLRKEFSFGSTEPVVYVLWKFDQASIEAQNALLKSLEEKKDWQHFILIAQSEGLIVPTIRSRARTVILKSATTLQTIRPETESFLSRLPSETSTSFLKNQLLAGLKKDEALLFVDEILLYYRRELEKNSEASMAIMKKCLQLKPLLSVNNIHVQLALDNLLIFCWKKVSMKSDA